MAYFLPNLSPPLLHQKDSKAIVGLPAVASPQTRPELPPTPATRRAVVPVSRSAGVEDMKQQDQRDEFYVNLGLAVRTLREDMPSIFSRDLNYDIYRDDITFRDPLNTFTGIENYKMIFWALRFHGRLLFSEMSLDVLRIWQPSETTILVRWNLRGVPRIPWEASGQFQATSRYKLDRNGRIYEHKVDNLAFNFPKTLKPAVSVLDLVAATASPNPTFLLDFDSSSSSSSSWIKLYRAVRGTLADSGDSMAVSQDCLATCS